MQENPVMRNFYFLLFIFWLKWANIFPQAIFTIPAPGVYQDSVTLTLLHPNPSLQIRYTTNGTEPNLNSSPFGTPFTLYNVSPFPNNYSSIPTNPSLNFPVPGYDTSRANNRGWLPPFGMVRKAVIIKAKAYNGNTPVGPTQCFTFFIFSPSESPFKFPVISLSFDSTDFFSNESGIYVYGFDTFNFGNYNKRLEKRKVFIEYFDSTHQAVFSQYCYVRIRGNGGRHAPQKSLRLMADNLLGPSRFPVKPFGLPHEQYHKNLVLRNIGHRPDCFSRDDKSCLLFDSLNFFSQHIQPVHVFFNGEYWGLQYLKEDLDESIFRNYFNFPANAVSILENKGSLDDGPALGKTNYDVLLNYAKQNDVSQSVIYRNLINRIDLSSYLDYQSAEIFAGNGDWPFNNVRFWQYPRQGVDGEHYNYLDGRWRWMLQDLDAAFGGDCSGYNFNYNALRRAVDTAYGDYNSLLRRLLLNQDFKRHFINRQLDLLNSAFKPEFLLPKMKAYDLAHDSLMPEVVRRWRYPSDSTTLSGRANEIPSLARWIKIKNGLNNFILNRRVRLFNHYRNQFQLGDTVKITLLCNNDSAGTIRINTLFLDKWLKRTTASVLPWIGTYLKGNAVELEAISMPGYKFKSWNGIDTNRLILVNPVNDTVIQVFFERDSFFHPWHYVLLNEVCTSNSNVFRDDRFQYDDWVEVYNPHAFSVNLNYFFVTDNYTQPLKYQFRSCDSNTRIPPKSHRVFWCDQQSFQGNLHANFSLSKSGDHVYLFLPDGHTLVDSLAIPPLSSNTSFGRYPDGTDSMLVFSHPTPERKNQILSSKKSFKDFTVFPNPARRGDKIEFSALCDFKLYDITGRFLAEYIQSDYIDTSILDSGIYILKTDAGEAARIIIQ